MADLLEKLWDAWLLAAYRVRFYLRAPISAPTEDLKIVTVQLLLTPCVDHQATCLKNPKTSVALSAATDSSTAFSTVLGHGHLFRKPF